MERNPHAINVESNPYQIELAGSDGQNLDSNGSGSNEYAPANHGYHLPTRASISRQGRALVKGVQDRGGCRLAICMLGVTLCWLSSLQVASTFVEIIFTPPKGGPQVQESWKQFSSQINLERTRNLECVNASLGGCQDFLSAKFDAVRFEVDVTAKQNEILVEQATAYQQRCADEQSNKLKIIQRFKLALTASSQEVLWNSACTEETTRNLNSLYSDPTMTTNQATTLTSQYGNNNDITWKMAYESMQARAAYDAEYWSNKTQQLKDWYTSQGLGLDVPSMPSFTNDFGNFSGDLSEYWACATFSNNPPCPHNTGLRASAERTVMEYQGKYNDMASRIAQQKADSEAYLSAARAKVSDYQNYATNVGQTLADIQATLDEMKTTCPALCQSEIDSLTSYFPKVPYVNVPDASVAGFNIPTVGAPNWTEIMAGLDFGNETAAINAKLAAMTANMNGAALGWGDSLNVNIGDTFAWDPSFGADFGYNPPPVDINASGVSNLTANYVSKTNEQLSDVSARLTPGGGSGGNKTSEILRSLQLGANSLSSTDYTYASLAGFLDIDLWFFSMNWLKFFSYFLDYAFRIWYSGRIFIRYWFGAAGTMAPIDIRSYRTTKATPLNVRIARYATHPIVLFGGAMVVAVLIVSVITGLYIPMLNDYVSNCVDADPLGTTGSSFVGNNVYAAAFNVAVLQGNRDLSQGLNQYDTARANLCGTEQQTATDTYANQQFQLRIVRDNLKTVVKLLDDMEICTNPVTWTLVDFEDATQTALPTPWHIEDCSLAGFDDLGTLEPPPINCTQLPQCDTRCAVDDSVVRGASHRASCETEWYVHTTILQAVCAIVVFIFWNVCRTLLLDGLVRIYWKHLVRGSGLNFYSTCNKNGQIDSDTEDQLAVAIKESDASARRMGCFYIVMSFLLNIPYIVFCILLNVDITYPY